MNNYKHIPFLLISLFACGGEAEDIENLDQVLLGFGAKNSEMYQFGTNTNASHLACNKTNTSQTCSVLANPESYDNLNNVKTFTWRFTPLHGFTSGDQAEVRSAMNHIDSALSKWIFTETTASSGSLQFAKADVPGSETSNNIDSFVGVRFDLPSALTEGVAAGANTPVGSYQRHSGCVITIDVTDIDERTSTGAAYARLFAHAAVNGTLKCIGMGARNDVNATGTGIYRTIDPSLLIRPAMTSADQCRANSYVPVDNGDYSLLFPECLGN